MDYRWSAAKDAWLRRERGVGFEALIDAIEAGGLLAEQAHPNPARTHQRVLWVEHQGQLWVLPYVMEGESRFIKTAYPSRQARRKFEQGERP